MRVVYHAHYLDYFEAARTDALREAGVVYRDLEDGGIMMPVVDLQLKYHRPCLYDEVLEVHTFVKEVPRTRIVIHYEVYGTGDPKCRVSGIVTLCFVDMARNRPVLAPASLQETFARAIAFGAEKSDS